MPQAQAKAARGAERGCEPLSASDWYVQGVFYTTLI